MQAIDIHAHYYPESYLRLFAEEAARLGTEYTTGDGQFSYKTPIGGQGPLPKKFIDVAERVADMDRQGVGVQAVSLTFPMVYWAEAALSHRLARAWNDGASAAHLAFPSRIVGLIALPMLDRDRAVDELERAAKLPGMRGVYMGTNIAERDLDDPAFAPIFARIEALGLPVFLHPLTTVGGTRTAPYYLSNLLGNPYDTGIAACHLVFGGVMDRHPRLEVNLPHAGGAFPYLIGRIDRGWKMRPETRALPQAPSAYLRRFSYDTISHSAPLMRYLISQVGADRVMIGSDYCYDMGYDEPVRMLDELGLAAQDRDLILAGNAARVLKLATD
jgi:aminocarboxymuconate-semialdehyde decarboxylase